MTVLDFLVLLAVAGLVGALGQSVAGYSTGGCLTSIVVGFIGALLGLWLSRGLGLPEFLAVRIGGTSFPILWSVVGSALFVFLIGLLSRRRLA
jgi:uncharacterized membrane protein YeaQ/YmgE (transglycosylase-associated protein family)